MSQRTPNLDLPYIAASQAQKHVTHNDAIRALDAVVHLSVVASADTVPATSPADGERYIVSAAPAGEWEDHAGAIAAWQDGAWMYYRPRVGWLAWVAAEQAVVCWNGSEWADLSEVALNPVSGGMVGINASADTTNRLAVASPATLFNHDGSSHQIKINKASAGATASVVYQTEFSGRAELGLAGDDDWSVKVSPDGVAWNQALLVDRNTGRVRFPASEPWMTYTPTVSAGAGSLGAFPPTATGAYQDVGSVRFFDILVTFPANYSAGSPTASGYIGVSIPAAPTGNMDNGMGREIAVVGSMLVVFGFAGHPIVRVLRLSDLGFLAGGSYVFHLQFSIRTA